MGWLVTAGTVLPGPAGERIQDGAVLVDGDTIVAVGERDQVERLAPPGAIRADFPGGTVLPGFIGSHVHLSFDAEKEQIESVAGLAAFHHAGVTTGRIIELATASSAAALRLTDVTGQLRKGLSADLLAVDGNPLDDLAALRHVRLVLARGNPA